MSAYEFHPLDASRWEDLVRLFETHSNPRSCWCQFWRLSPEDWKASSLEERRANFRGAVEDGRPVGVLAYLDGDPVGWCSISPRDIHGRVRRTRAMGRLDDADVWSVTCFFVHRSVRHTGLTNDLLEAAVTLARARGADVVEGYPVVRRIGDDGRPVGAPFRFMGDASIYRRAGFTDVAPEDRPRRLMRLDLRQGAG